MRKAGIFFLLFLFSPLSFSFDRGDKLLWACNAELDSVENAMAKSHCVGYLQGILDGAQIIFGLSPSSRLFFPPESGMSGDQQLRIVTKYLEENPDKLHESPRVSVLVSYAKAFPCK